MRAPRPGKGNHDEAVEFFRADERERRPVSARNGTVCGRVMGYLDKSPTSNEHPDSACHMPGTELRSPAHRHRSAGAHLTHLSDHGSRPSPRRSPESSPPSPGRSSSASDHRASRLPAETSWSRAAARSPAAGLLLRFLGALCVLAPGLLLPVAAEAQLLSETVWSATLTVSDFEGVRGCADADPGYTYYMDCSDSDNLSVDEFTYD